MTDQFQVVGGGARSAKEIVREAGVDVFQTIGASAITVADDWHGKLVRFAGACTVTVPAGLRADFSCGWSQDGADPITFTPDEGVTLESLEDNLVSAGQYAVGGIACMGPDVYRLFGNLTSS